MRGVETMGENFALEYDFTSEELEDINRCVENLYSTRAGSQPLDREFGIDYDSVVGLPHEVAKNQLTLEYIEKTARYEPRVAVDSVDIEVDAMSGQMISTIHLVKGEADDE